MADYGDPEAGVPEDYREPDAGTTENPEGDMEFDASPHGGSPMSNEASWEGPASRPAGATALAGAYTLATVLLLGGAVLTFLALGAGGATVGLGLLILGGAIGAVAIALSIGREWGWYAAAGAALLALLAGLGAILEGAVAVGLGAIVVAAALGVGLALPNVRDHYHVGSYGYYERTE